MASERSPLLRRRDQDDPEAGPSQPRRDEVPLANRAAQLLDHLERSYRAADSLDGAARLSASYGSAELSTLLYSAATLGHRRNSKASSIRDRLAQSAVNDRLREAIYNRIEDVLDGENQALHHAEEPQAVNGQVTAALSQEYATAVDEEVEEMCWRQRDEGGSGRTVSAMDLLLPPRQKRSSPFLSHPLIQHAVHEAWCRGVLHTEPPARSWRRPKIYERLSPRAWHELHLLSFVVLYALTLSLAIRPTGRLQPDDEDLGRKARVTSAEILWTGLGLLSLLIDFISRSHPLRLVLLVPTYLGIVAYIANLISGAAAVSQLAYTMVVLSIPALTFAVILPLPPSLPLLAPRSSLVPLSALLLSTLNRSLRPLMLLTPAIVFVLALFSWSMDGDVFRGFSNPGDTHLIRNGPSPLEDGIAPFAARVSLFVTVLLLLLAGITLGTARSMIPSPGVSGQGGRRWRGAIRPGDDWEEEYGLTAARRARKAFALAVKQYI